MTIDGVGGLRPGNLFRVDYLPEIYRDYTYFQIFTIGHTINTSGWTTSIGAKMKLDFPKMIKDGLIGLDSETPLTKPEQPTVPTLTGESEDDDLADDFVIEETTLDEFEPWEAPAPPPPNVPTIDDPYDEELVTDFVIEETTLDDFEPWEAPAPFVADESGIDEVEVNTGDTSVYTENDTTKVKQEKVQIKVRKKADVTLDKPKEEVDLLSFEALHYSVEYNDGIYFSEVIGTMKKFSGEIVYVYGQGSSKDFSFSQLEARSSAQVGAANFNKVGYNGYTGEPMGGGLITNERFVKLKGDFKKKNEAFRNN